MATGQRRQQLPGAPERMRDPLDDEAVGHRRGNLVGAVMRRVAPIDQAGPAFRLVARQPDVPHSPTHTIPRTELAHVVAVTLRVSNKSQSLVHFHTLLPWHDALPKRDSSCRLRALPILPDYSVTYLPGPYPTAR